MKKKKQNTLNTIKRGLVMLTTIIIGFVLVGCGTLLGFQRKMMYFPQAYIAETPSQMGAWKVEPVRFETSNGIQESYFLRKFDANAEAEPEVLCVAFHGNASRALDWLLVHLETLEPKNDMTFLLVDYPGYGSSEGSPTRSSIIENGEESFKALMSQKVWDQETIQIKALGYSMGAAAAMEFSARHDVDSIILVAPFSSMYDMAKRTVPWPFYYTTLDRYDNVARVEEVLASDAPPSIIVFHGVQDEIIPVEMSRSLKEKSPEIILHEIQGASHNSVLDQAGQSFTDALLGQVTD